MERTTEQKQLIPIRRAEWNAFVIESLLFGALMAAGVMIFGPALIDLDPYVWSGLGVTILMLSLAPVYSVFSRTAGRQLSAARIVAIAVLAGIVTAAIHALFVVVGPVVE